MSSPIKPTNGATGSPVPELNERVTPRSAPTFDAADPADELSQVTRGGTESISSDLKSLAAALQNEAIDPVSVVEHLLEKALGAPEAMALTDAGRSQLKAHLRTLISEDPTLRALVQDLSRAGHL